MTDQEQKQEQEVVVPPPEAGPPIPDLEAGKTALLSLAVALRSVGKASSVDRMEELHRLSADLCEAVVRVAERMPSATGRVLWDLLSESGPAGQDLRRRLRDPRSYRTAADAVERFLGEGPDEAVAAFGTLPEERFPLRGLKKVGLFLLGIRRRGTGAVAASEDRAKISDTDLTVAELGVTEQRLDAWHRSYATAALAKFAERPAGRQDSFGADSGHHIPLRTPLPRELELSEAQTDRLGEIVRLEDEGLSRDDRIRFRRLVVFSIFLFIRLLQRPYAVRFQRRLCFGLQAKGSSFVRPLVVLLAVDAEPWEVVRSIGQALDHAFSSDGAQSSSEDGPMRALAEVIHRSSGVPVEDAFAMFLESYLRILAAQQGISGVSTDGPVDKQVVGRHHALFLEVLLDEQREALQRSGQQVGADIVENTITAIVGALGIGSVAWFFPQR